MCYGDAPEPILFIDIAILCLYLQCTCNAPILARLYMRTRSWRVDRVIESESGHVIHGHAPLAVYIMVQTGGVYAHFFQDRSRRQP